MATDPSQSIQNFPREQTPPADNPHLIEFLEWTEDNPQFVARNLSSAHPVSPITSHLGEKGT